MKNESPDAMVLPILRLRENRCKLPKHARRMTIRFATLFIFLTALSLPAQEPGVPSQKEMDEPITSLLVRDKEIFAVNASGMFRADVSRKTWRRVPLPDYMPAAGGAFAGGVLQGRDIVYVARAGTPEKDLKYGIYESQDDGATWRLVSENAYGEVFVAADGKWYAVISKDWRPGGGENQLVESDNGGKTWRTILDSAKSGDSYNIENIFPDPDHPGQVAVSGNSGTHDYAAQATDASYQKWNFTRGWGLQNRKETDEDFFQKIFSSSTAYYALQATPGNYFKYEFQGDTSICALDFVLEKRVFQFKKEGPKAIHVAMQFREPNITIKLPDEDDTNGMYALRIVTPDGERKFVEAKPKERFDLKGIGKTDAEMVEAGKLSVHDVSMGHPYERSIDLGAAYDFSKAGAYKVQLIYVTGRAGNSTAGTWGGTVSSDVFTVNIE